MLNSNLTESASTSAVKVAVSAASTAMATIGASDTGGPSPYQITLWVLTGIYAGLQIFKCLPWASDYVRALWRIVRHGDWSHWWSLAKRGEHTQDGDINA